MYINDIYIFKYIYKGVKPTRGGGFPFLNDMQMGSNVVFCRNPVLENPVGIINWFVC